MFGWGIKSVTTDELARRIDAGQAKVVDVREPYEYEAGHVPGAVNVPLGTIPKRLGELERSAPVYLICQAGHRSMNAARLLKRSGFDPINVKGGTSAWHGPLER